jgi:uncharacterized integral membrane protein
MLQKIRWFLLITGVSVAVIIALRNQTPTTLDLLFFNSTIPLTLLLLATGAANFVFGALTTVWMLKKKEPAKAKQEPQPAKPEQPAKTPQPDL